MLIILFNSTQHEEENTDSTSSSLKVLQMLENICAIKGVQWTTCVSGQSKGRNILNNATFKSIRKIKKEKS